MKQLVAVYGTLKENESNYFLMEQSGAVLVDAGQTQAKFTMYDGWGFPRVTFHNEGVVSPIQCEVFEVDTLSYLDDLEGHPDFFERKEVMISLGGLPETEVKAWMYFHPPIEGQEYTIRTDGYWTGRSEDDYSHVRGA